MRREPLLLRPVARQLQPDWQVSFAPFPTRQPWYYLTQDADVQFSPTNDGVINSFVDDTCRNTTLVTHVFRHMELVPENV